MIDSRAEYSDFISMAASCFDEAKNVLNQMDEECTAHNIAPFELAEDGEIVDALARLMAATRISSMSEVVRKSLKAHDVLGHIETIVGYTTILLCRDEESPSVNIIDQLQTKAEDFKL